MEQVKEYGKISPMNHKWVGVILCAAGVFLLLGANLPGGVEERNLEIPLAQAFELNSTEIESRLPEEMLSTCSVNIQTRWRGLTLARKTEAITQTIHLVCARPPAGETFAIRARVDEPARLIFPDNDNSKPLTPGSPLMMSWALHPGDARKWEGTLWTYLSIPTEAGESSEVILSSIQLTGRTTRLVWLNFPQSLAAGIALIILGLLVFSQIWRVFGKRRT